MWCQWIWGCSVMDLSLAGEEMVTQAAGWSPPHSDILTSDLLSGGNRIIPQPVCNGSAWSANGLPCLEINFKGKNHVFSQRTGGGTARFLFHSLSTGKFTVCYSCGKSHSSAIAEPFMQAVGSLFTSTVLLQRGSVMFWCRTTGGHRLAAVCSARANSGSCIQQKQSCMCRNDGQDDFKAEFLPPPSPGDVVMCCVWSFTPAGVLYVDLFYSSN